MLIWVWYISCKKYYYLCISRESYKILNLVSLMKSNLQGVKTSFNLNVKCYQGRILVLLERYTKNGMKADDPVCHQVKLLKLENIIMHIYIQSTFCLCCCFLFWEVKLNSNDIHNWVNFCELYVIESIIVDLVQISMHNITPGKIDTIK